MSLAPQKLAFVQEKINKACAKAARDVHSVRLIGVSKTKPAAAIASFYEAGLHDFGENYVQESLEKINNLSHLSQINWHFIGKLQSNKAKFIPGHFHYLHSLDTLSVAKRINDLCAKQAVRVKCLVEINIDEENTKSGLLPKDLERFLSDLRSLPNIDIAGLMCIPEAKESPELTRGSFAKLRDLLVTCNDKGYWRSYLTELSMGMSSDFEQAILEGATIVRVGTLLFGERN